MVLFFSLLAAGWAAPDSTQPEEIRPITKAELPFGYYVEQSGLWKLEIEADRLNARAWLNYFRAARYANMLADTLAQPFDLDAIVAQLPTELSQTFEFNYILFIRENNTEHRFEHLLRAHELAPERAEAFTSLVNYHITEGDWEQAKVFCEKLFAAGEYSPTLLAWNYNALASVEPNAILLTHGDNDTYPAWVLQAVKGLRPDVEVLNVNLLFYDDYRERVFKKLDFQPIDSAEFLAYQDMYLAIARSFMEQADRPVYLATSIPEFIRKILGDSLYLTGLAFRHATQPFDNVAVLKENFEHRFLLDHLKIQLETDTTTNVLANMNLHYLPALITLHRHYAAVGESKKAADVESLLRQVAKAGGRGEEVSTYLNTAKKD